MPLSRCCSSVKGGLESPRVPHNSLKMTCEGCLHPPSVSSCCLSFLVCSPPFPTDVLAEEFAHPHGDGVALLFQGEVPGVQQVIFQRLQVTFVRYGTGCREDLVVPAPYNQHWRLMFPEVLLPPRVQRRIAPVAQEQIESDLVVP